VNHIKTPVQSSRRELIENGIRFASVYSIPADRTEIEAIIVAAEIAAALNAHDALVALAASLLRGGMRETEERLPEIRAAARDALALVRGEST